MPDEQLEFKSNLILALEAQGVENAAKAFEKIIKAEKKAGKSVDDLIDKYGSLDRATKALAKAYKEKGRIASDALEKEIGKVDKLIGVTRKLRGYLGEAGDAFKKLVVPSSLGASLRTFDSYNKNLIAMSANVNRLGIGFGDLEKTLKGVAKTTAFTTLETQKLFQQYQEGMRVISEGDFKAVSKRIDEIFGGNVEEAGKMQDALAEMSQKAPLLAKSLIDLAKNQSKATKSEKDALQLRLHTSAAINGLASERYKILTAYIRGNDQLTKEQQDQLDSSIATAKAMKEFAEQAQRVQIIVGSALAPYLKKAADWMEAIKNGTRDWKKDLLLVGGVLAGIGIGKGILSGLGRGIGGGIGRKLLGGRGRGLGGGMIGSITGRGSPVYVTNWPMMGGLGGVAAGGAGRGFLPVGGLGGKGLKAGKSLGIGLALMAGAYGAKKGGEALTAKGYGKTGGGAGIAGGLLGIGGAAMTGAAIGTVIPGLGTAVGAIIGGLIGAGVEAKGLISNFKAMTGKAKKVADIEKDINNTTEDINKETKKQVEHEENIRRLKQQQIERARSLEALYGSQSNHLDVIIRKMGITGQINQSVVNKAIEDTIKLLDVNISSYEQVAEVLRENKNIILDEILARKNLLPIAEAYFQEIKQSGRDEIESANELLKVQAIIDSKEEERSKTRLKAVKTRDLELEQAGLLVQQAGLMVQLYDNLAIGVGASADMRIRQFRAEEQNIKVLQKQYKANQDQISAGDDSVLLRNQQLDIENKIWQSQMNQAQQVRALRDGWVSALGAMNTGFGGFTEIIMDANNGLSLMQQQAGSVRSALSGAVAGVGEDVGYNVSERFSADGRTKGIASVISIRYGASMGGKGKAAYGGTVFGEFDPRNLERGKREEVMGILGARAQEIAGSGGSALGAGNAIALAAEIESRSSGSSTVINQKNIYNIHSNDPDEVARTVDRKVKEGFEYIGKSQSNWNQP